MQQRPSIKTAIPKHRYQIGDYAASLLGEIESDDACQYRWILAFVPMGRREPELYVCAEHAPPAERAEGAYRLRVVSDALSEVVDSGDQWCDLERFAEQGLRLGAQVLGLQREAVITLM